MGGCNPENAWARINRAGPVVSWGHHGFPRLQNPARDDRVALINAKDYAAWLANKTASPRPSIAFTTSVMVSWFSHSLAASPSLFRSFGDGWLSLWSGDGQVRHRSNAASQTVEKLAGQRPSKGQTMPASV